MPKWYILTLKTITLHSFHSLEKRAVHWAVGGCTCSVLTSLCQCCYRRGSIAEAKLHRAVVMEVFWVLEKKLAGNAFLLLLFFLIHRQFSQIQLYLSTAHAGSASEKLWCPSGAVTLVTLWVLPATSLASFFVLQLCRLDVVTQLDAYFNH